MRERRVFCPGIDPAGGELVLGREESHHLERVLRLGPGARVTVFDGRGGEWRAEVVAVGRPGTRLRLGEPLEGPVDPALEVRLYQGLCRADRMELAIQKGTEIGIVLIRPLPCERSDAPAPSARRLERWRRIAREAAKQCGRRHVPEIEPAGEAPAVAGGVLGLVLDPRTARPIGDVLARERPRAVWLAVGPEGGFTEEELGALAARGWVAVDLGPRVLRTETAGPLAAALVLHRWGDLGRAEEG